MGDSRELPAGEVIAAFGSPEERWYTVTATATGYCIRFRECGEFLISADLTEVQVRRDAAAPHANLLPIVMAGTVSALLLALRGATVLHASAVAINGTALGFVGPSGRGKSTIAALMCVNGAKLVTDDLLTVDAGRPVMCVGAARELRLRPNAVALVEEHPDAITRQTVDERLALTVESAPLEPLPLAAIVMPGPSRTANGGRCPAAVATGCAVEVPGVPTRLWLAPARCADTRLRHAESPGQRRAGVRGGDPLGTTVRALGRPCPRGARRWTRRTGALKSRTWTASPRRGGVPAWSAQGRTRFPSPRAAPAVRSASTSKRPPPVLKLPSRNSNCGS